MARWNRTFLFEESEFGFKRLNFFLLQFQNPLQCADGFCLLGVHQAVFVQMLCPKRSRNAIRFRPRW